METFNGQAMIDAVAEAVSTWGVKVVGALGVLILGWLVARLVRRAVQRALGRMTLEQTLVLFVGSLSYYLLLTFVGIAVLNLFGVPTTSFIAVLGAAGLAVGLALQGTLSNFAAGFMLMIFRPFRIGDYVEVAGVEGTVREIQLFTTTLDSLDNVQVVIPNSEAWGKTVRNLTGNDTRRVDMTFGIAYEDDIDQARKLILGVLAADARVLKDPPPLVEVWELADSSVNLLVGAWAKPGDYWDLRFALTQKIKEDLQTAGFTIPFPQRDVHIFQGEQVS